MKQKELEILLQKTPGYNNPKPGLEQYLTPAPIAADILFTATQLGDIKDKTIADLGCGTGIFSIGAYLCGAAKVIGFDVDSNCINQARDYAYDKNYSINFSINEIRNVTIVCDTVITNPPFGAQKSNIQADRAFILKGFEIAGVIYSLHLSKTIPFIEKMIESLEGKITNSKNYDFTIKRTFDFHKKKSVTYNVTLLRIETSK